jgi:DNA-binding transcriptional regulator YiaG
MTPRQVKKLREKLGLLQRELAVNLGVSTRTVQGWENGRRPHGSAAKLMKDLEQKFDEAAKSAA